MQIKIEKLACGGNGIGVLDGKMFFVPFSAAGDVLDVEITDDHGSYGEAKIIKILESSPERVEPLCPVFYQCGGCQWQHMSYDAQVKWKKNILKDTLERIAKISSPFVLDTLRSPKQWNYRNRIQLHVSKDGAIGFYKQKSYEVVEFEKCFIAEEELNEQLAANRDEIRTRQKGIGLRLTGGGSFSQVNTLQNEQLKAMLCEWLKEIPHDNVLELYAGSGNFTFEIAKVAKFVIASDCDAKAIECARKLAEENGVENIKFYIKPAAKAVKFVDGECDVVILDPPRKGCVDAVDDILKLRPKAILYVSCDPATLSRDLASFIAKGYRHQKSLPVDMFPQTHHVESVNLLTLQ